ncbi:DUF3164 family protein [Kingella kingae]|nr:DUF3164 family protein [Kingella kingae]
MRQWHRAMPAIVERIHPQTTREYIRIHRRDENGAYVLVSPELGKA